MEPCDGVDSPEKGGVNGYSIIEVCRPIKIALEFV
jgi:hypothetical protein